MKIVLDNTVYKGLLKGYIETQDQKYLCSAKHISKDLLDKGISAEDIVALHNDALLELYPDMDSERMHSMDFLLESMISYGAAHQEFITLLKKQEALKSEVAVAASMQKTLLETTVPKINNLDIGVISVPAEQMNGDYYQFFKEEDGSLEIVLADVIGKGVPAALCMSMIKYSMDSFSVDSMTPSITLKNLNRVVNRNVASSMYITMFYAQYFPQTNKMQYASAGHEPGFYFRAKDRTFTEIETEGLVLGVLPDSTYKQYEQNLSIGDMIILLTDGVTEYRLADGFIERDELLDIINKYTHLDAQAHVNKIYDHIKTTYPAKLKDDFTLIIIKRNV